MIQIATKKDTNAIVLDFFAGSGTTGEAVLDVNAEDGGNRRFILVQLDYALDPSKKQQRAAIRFCDTHKKPRVASELTKERIRRASVRVASEHPDTNIDVGFRVFRQANSSIIPWEPDRTDLENSLLTSVDHIDATRSESDLFFELLLRLGKDLATDIEEHAINEKRIFVAPNAQLLACLALSITELDVEPLARALITLRPVVRADDVTCVFRDDAFASDTAKADLLAVLEQHGMPNVRTL
jgi:adenine-specific DNA-methyltransferase